MTNIELIKAAIPQATDIQAQRFEHYMALLLEWNEKMNLTAITDPNEVAQKHFADSILAMEHIPQNARCIDVGTGAGFPGVPLMIMREDIHMTLLDSLNKRLIFLEEVMKELGLKAKIVHMRAEDGGRDPGFRGKYDIALTRAVTNTSAVLEWTTPFLKVGGKSLMYKGPKAEEELEAAARALTLLNCKAEVVTYDVPWGERKVTIAQKTAPTPKQYPRKAGSAAKNPL